MTVRTLGCVVTAASSLALLQCGSENAQQLAAQNAGRDSLFVAERTPELISGHVVTESGTIELSSVRRAPLAGDVQIELAGLRYAVHYDFAERRVVSDGDGAALDRAAQRMLGAGLDLVTAYLGPDNPDLPLQEQLLHAAMAMLHESGGMPLERTTFQLEPEPLEKSLENDGVGCIERDESYPASFDYGAKVVERMITADASECNGRCGPTCTQLSPWNMWTLDCLEHDACCDETSGDTCWTPLGECGDEYGHALTDFLRGFDPLNKHCGG